MRKKTDNSGFTLMEMIVVIAIIAVMLTIAGLSLSVVFSTDAKKTAASVSSALSTCRENNRSREGKQTFLALKCDEAGRLEAALVVNGAISDTKRISSKNVSVTVDGTELSGDTTLYVSFYRGTGGVRTFMTGTYSGSLLEAPDSMSLLDTELDSRSGGDYGEIHIASGNKKYVVSVDMVTAKVASKAECRETLFRAQHYS